MSEPVGPVTVAYYYRIRWGGQAEFVELFERNHWPVLRDQLASGRFLDVRAYTPRFHGDGRADWTFLVTITYRDWAAMEAHARSSDRGAAVPGSASATRRRSGGASSSSRRTGTCHWRSTRLP